MKKFILFGILLTAVGIYSYKNGWKKLFIPSYFEKIKGKGIVSLRSNAIDAEDSYKDEIEGAEKAGAAFLKLGRKYLEYRDWTPAIDALKKAIGYGRSGSSVHSSLGIAYGNRAKALGDKKDIEMAEFHYKKAIKISPKLSEGYYGLSILKFYLKKEKKEAVKLIRKLVRNEPDHYRARFALGRFYYELGDLSKSLVVYQNLSEDLQGKQESTEINEYKNKSSENIMRIRTELKR